MNTIFNGDAYPMAPIRVKGMAHTSFNEVPEGLMEAKAKGYELLFHVFEPFCF